MSNGRWHVAGERKQLLLPVHHVVCYLNKVLVHSLKRAGTGREGLHVWQNSHWPSQQPFLYVHLCVYTFWKQHSDFLGVLAHRGDPSLGGWWGTRTWFFIPCWSGSRVQSDNLEGGVDDFMHMSTWWFCWTLICNIEILKYQGCEISWSWTTVTQTQLLSWCAMIMARHVPCHDHQPSLPECWLSLDDDSVGGIIHLQVLQN